MYCEYDQEGATASFSWSLPCPREHPGYNYTATVPDPHHHTAIWEYDPETEKGYLWIDGSHDWAGYYVFEKADVTIVVGVPTLYTFPPWDSTTGYPFTLFEANLTF